MTLVDTVKKVLGDPGIAKINFILNGLVVTAKRYGEVLRAVEDKRIACEVPKRPEDRVVGQAKGMEVEATYKSDKNAMLFPRADYGQQSEFEQSVIVHEATHAIFDVHAQSKNDRTLAIDDESAAVLAQALFIKLCNLKAPSFSRIVEGSGYEALRVANEMMVETENFQTGPVPFIVRPDQIVDLRLAVGREWNFVRKDEPDGGYTDDSTAQYIYNGVPGCLSCWLKEEPSKKKR